MKNYYQLPADLHTDIATYASEVRRFLAGEMPSAMLKAKRVPRGVYEQRQNGTFMVRVRVAGGTVTNAQAQEMATLSREFGNGLLHITTRQDLQFHDVNIAHTPTVMQRLLGVGLTTKGGGGNTVRNITACPYAGICPRECFDVTPCVHAATEYLIALVGAYNLPRKYKIAFSGCAADCALAQVSDLGFIAEVREGVAGFRVMAGGGMGANSRLSDTLQEWVPTSEIFRVAETVRRLFDQHGDRSNRHRARIRYIFERLGVATVRQHYTTEMAQVMQDGVPAWQASANLALVPPSGESTAPHLETRHGIRVLAQRQAGYFAVPLHTPLGFLPAADFARIGELAAQYGGEDGLRTMQAQQLLLRFVREADLPALATDLEAIKTKLLTPVPLDRFVACAGAATCRLGFCLARDAAKACASALARPEIQRTTLDAMTFHLNGCANACGQQPIGAIGFFGVAQRVGERLVPSYNITLGGRCNALGARFGTAIGKVPARALPTFTLELARDFQTQRAAGENFLAYVDRLGLVYFQAMATRHATIPAYSAQPDFYRDLGAAEEFSLAGRGAGECGAGVFEVIQNDLAAAKQATTPFDRLIPTARALLFTRGVDAQDPLTVLKEFERLFVQTGLVSAQFLALLHSGRSYAQGDRTALDQQQEAIEQLRQRVELLHSSLDANLEFHPPEEAPAAAARPPCPCQAAAPACSATTCHTAPTGVDQTAPATAELNLRGVACPMNFVKAKLRLETLAIGETLALILDDGDPLRNVPASFQSEGQQIIASTPVDNGAWRVIVQKNR